MNAQSELQRVSAHLNGLQSRVEALIAEQLGFRRGPGMTLDQEMDAQDAACEAIEQWAEAKDCNPGLVAGTPLQVALDEHVSLHGIYLDALDAAGFRR